MYRFFENYAMKIQNEVQDMHSLVFVLDNSPCSHYLSTESWLWPNHGQEQNPLRGALYYYISNEKDHDTLFVQRAFRLHWEFFKSKGYQPK
jgi:hypothetical protein